VKLSSHDGHTVEENCWETFVKHSISHPSRVRHGSTAVMFLAPAVRILRMCGRFTLRTPASRLADVFSIPLLRSAELPLRFNIAPTQSVVVIRRRPDSSEMEAVSLRWGLIPRWARDARSSASLINAQSETIATKPAFRDAFKRRRCLIPADGFYEWQVVPGRKTKQPHFISLRDDQPFAFAGIWEAWKNPEGERVESFAVITTEANEIMRPLHDRMPVILPPKSHAVWLDPNTPVETLQALLVPFPASDMKEHPVSPLVGNPRSQGEVCIQPLDRVEPSLPFGNAVDPPSVQP
jgi:putative SOS response-associated peptidase YedK